MNTHLKTRLNKLEAAIAEHANGFRTAVLVGIYDNNADDIVGAGIGGKRVERQAGETLNALTVRASRELGMQFLFAVYKDGTEAS